MKITSRAGLVFLLAGAGAGACTSILGGFDYGATGGTGGVGGSSSSSSSGSSSSSSSGTGGQSTTDGGTDGMAEAGPMPKCTEIGGQIIPVITPAELGALPLGDSLLVVADPGAGSSPSVHVVVANGATSGLYARTVLNQSSPPTGPLVSFGQGMPNGMTCTQSSDCQGGYASCLQGKCYTSNAGFSPSAASVVPGASLNLQGRLTGTYQGNSGGIGQLALPISASMEESVQQTAMPAYTPWPTPVDCASNGFPSSLVVWPTSTGATLYALACALNTPANAATLWLGSSDATTTPVKVAAGVRTDALMNPQAYAFLNNQHFIAFQGQGSGGPGPSGYAYASDPATLAAAYTQLTLVTGQFGIPMALVPTPANDGFAFFLASIDPGLASASLWSGVVTPADYAKLAMTPPPQLKQFYSTTSVPDVGGISSTSVDAKSIYGAGASFGGTSVNLTWTRRDGTPLVVEQQVYSSTNATCSASHTCNKVLNAGVAVQGSTALVVWSEQTAASPPAYMVNALRYLCTGD